MTIKTVFLHAASETLDPGRSAAHYALGLAHHFEAHLDALVLELDVVTPKSFYGRQIATDHRAQVRQRNADVATAAAALREAADTRGVDATVITERSHVHSTPEIAVDYARLADIAVAGVCQEGLLSERTIAEALIFESGRPVLVVPVDHDTGFAARRIVVGWDYSRTAARAVADALPLLRMAQDVTLVSFGDDKDFATSLSSEDVVAALRRRGVECRFEQMERRGREIGEAISNAAAEREADLLVIGGFGQSRARSFVLGGATRTILAAPALPTLFSH